MGHRALPGAMGRPHVMQVLGIRGALCCNVILYPYLLPILDGMLHGTMGFWVRCEDITWNTSDGRCPIAIDIGPHDHRVDASGAVGILVQATGDDREPMPLYRP